MDKSKLKGIGLGVILCIAFGLVVNGVMAGSIEHEWLRVPYILDSSGNTAVDVDSKEMLGTWSGGNWPENSLGFNVANQTELDTHTGNTSNPHSVTWSQTGGMNGSACPDGEVRVYNATSGAWECNATASGAADGYLPDDPATSDVNMNNYNVTGVNQLNAEESVQSNMTLDYTMYNQSGYPLLYANNRSLVQPFYYGGEELPTRTWVNENDDKAQINLSTGNTLVIQEQDDRIISYWYNGSEFYNGTSFADAMQNSINKLYDLVRGRGTIIIAQNLESDIASYDVSHPIWLNDSHGTKIIGEGGYSSLVLNWTGQAYDNSASNNFSDNLSSTFFIVNGSRDCRFENLELRAYPNNSAYAGFVHKQHPLRDPVGGGNYQLTNNNYHDINIEGESTVDGGFEYGWYHTTRINETNTTDRNDDYNSWHGCNVGNFNQTGWRFDCGQCNVNTFWYSSANARDCEGKYGWDLSGGSIGLKEGSGARVSDATVYVRGDKAAPDYIVMNNAGGELQRGQMIMDFNQTFSVRLPVAIRDTHFRANATYFLNYSGYAGPLVVDNCNIETQGDDHPKRNILNTLSSNSRADGITGRVSHDMFEGPWSLHNIQNTSKAIANDFAFIGNTGEYTSENTMIAYTNEEGECVVAYEGETFDHTPTHGEESYQILTAGSTGNELDWALDNLSNYGGGKLFIKSGTYSQTIDSGTSNITIVGEGKSTIIDGGGVILRGDDVNAKSIYFQSDSSSALNMRGNNFLVDNCWFETSGASGVNAFKNLGGQFGTLSKSIVVNASEHGVYILGENTTILDLLVENAGTKGAGYSDLTIRGNHTYVSGLITKSTTTSDDSIYVYDGKTNNTIFGWRDISGDGLNDNSVGDTVICGAQPWSLNQNCGG